MHFKRDLAFGDGVDADTLTSWLEPFVGSVEISEWSLFDNAWENLVYRCRTNVGSLVVRVSTMPDDSLYRDIARLSLERELLFTRCLQAEDIPAVKFVEGKRTSHVMTELAADSCRRFVMVQELLAGDPLGTSAVELRAMAHLQAGMHAASVRITLPEVPLLDNGYSAFADRQRLLDEVITSDSSLAGPLTSLESELATLHRPIIGALVQYRRQQSLFPIHADLTTPNVLSDGKGVVTGVLDFNDCRLGSAAEDIGTTLWSLGDAVDDPADVASRYLESYRSTGVLSEQDQQIAVQYAIDRYLVINRHYLRHHPAGSDELASQEEQAIRQLATISAFMAAFDVRT